MQINDPHDFSNDIESDDDLIQTTQCIQKSCNDIRQELEEVTCQGNLPPEEYQGLQAQIDSLRACATTFLRMHRKT